MIMKKTFIVGMVFLFVVSAAWCSLGSKNQDTIIVPALSWSVIESENTEVKKITEYEKASFTVVEDEWTDVLLDGQSLVHKTESLSLLWDSMWMDDEGSKSIYVLSGSTGEERVAMMIDSHATWSYEENWNEVSLKTLKISVQWSSFTIKWWAPLVHHMYGKNLSIIEDGDDAVISIGNEWKTPPFIIFDNEMENNYLINDPSDWRSEKVYMIPRKKHSMIFINFGSDWKEYTVKYDEHRVTSLYGYGREGTEKTYQKIAIAWWVDFILSARQKAKNVWVYHLSGDGDVSIKERLLADWFWFAHDGIWWLLSTNVWSVEELIQRKDGTRKVTSTDDWSQWIVVAEDAYVYLFELQNAPLDVTIKHDVYDDTPYIFEIDSNKQIDKEKTLESLHSVFWEDRVSMRGTRSSNFTVKPIPGEQYEWVVDVHSIYGEVSEEEISFWVNVLRWAVIEQRFVADSTMSLLAEGWLFSDLLVEFENIEEFWIDVTPCTVSTWLEWLSSFKWSWVENYFFDCDETRKEQVTVSPIWEEFEYRKLYRTAVVIPESMQADQAFRFALTWKNGKKHVHHAVKSNIGLWSKIADKKMYVRWFSLQSWEPLQEWTVTVTALGWWVVWEGMIEKGNSVIHLSIPDEFWDWENRWKKTTFVVEVTSWEDSTFFIANSDWRENIYIKHLTQNNRSRSLNINSRLSPNEVQGATQDSVRTWWKIAPYYMYGHANRSLYKAWDMIELVWYVRDITRFESLDYLEWETVEISINDAEGKSVFTQSSIPLDDYGAFTSSYQLEDSASLWDYFIEYRLSSNPDTVSFSHNIKVQEYQKPTYFAELSQVNTDWNIWISIAPQYYFWSPLQQYDINLAWSTESQQFCWYCRWWSSDTEEKYYYNYVFDWTTSTWWALQLYNQTDERVEIPLLSFDALWEKPYTTTIQTSVTMKDRASDEVQYFSSSFEVKPPVEIGLSWSPWAWQYKSRSQDSRDTYTIQWLIKEWLDEVSTLQYKVYYWSYDYVLEEWVDNNLYYVWSNPYVEITSWVLDAGREFTVPTDFIDNWWSYVVAVEALNAEWKILWVVEKKIEFYMYGDPGADQSRVMGAIPNNYTLAIDIPKRDYWVGDEIPVNIAPYLKDGYAVVTVEKGQYILDSKIVQLDWSPIMVEVKDGYAPNVVVSVMQIQWVDDNEYERKEPRFYAWFAGVDISLADRELDISLSTDKEIYKPGEEVSVTVQTSDKDWVPVDSRVTVAVIDQALMNLYNEEKNPLVQFFFEMWTSVYSFTNMKLLYQSLKAFATWGEKWWWWMWWQAMFGYVRDDLKDTSFWSWWVITSWWEATFTFTLPENLTTWVVDTVGITKDSKLWTAQHSFITSKDLIIESNPPLFVVAWDVLSVPVKVLSLWWKDWTVQWFATMENSEWERVDLWTFESPTNSKVMMEVTIPNSRWESQYISLTVWWTFEWDEDWITHSIPLRADWLVARESRGTISKEWTFDPVLPETHTKEAWIRLSQLPTNFVYPLVDYLFNYRYWNTEHSLSKIATLDLVKQMKWSWLFESTSAFADGVVHTEFGKISMDQYVKNTLSKVYRHQHYSGWFSYWLDVNWNPTDPDYMLTAYTYWTLLRLSDYSDDQNRQNIILADAEEYLTKKRDEWWTIGYMYFLAQKAMARWWISDEEIVELWLLKDEFVKTEYASLLRYIIAVYTNESNTKKWMRIADIPSNNDRWEDHSIYLNQVTGEALLLQAYAKDSSVEQKDRAQLVLSLIKRRWDNGLRWWSTQNNVQVLRALVDIITIWKPKESVNCTITLWWREQQVSLWWRTVFTSSIDLNEEEGETSWSCDSLIMSDVSVKYIPKDLEELPWAFENVQEMSWSTSNPSASVGEKITIVGSFETTTVWEDVAVELFVPSEMKLLDVISSFEENETPFIVSDRHCRPTHRESQFDRLFLFYDVLSSGVCDITTTAIKAYDWETTVMPMRVWEMYRGAVNWRHVILNK